MKHLIESNGTIYTVEGGTLAEVEGDISASTFQAHGFESVTGVGDLLRTLPSATVYGWNADKYRVVYCDVEGLPSPQDIVTTEVNLSASDIISVEEITATYSGNPLIAIAFDNAPYVCFNTVSRTWDTAPEHGGMTIPTLQAITENEWTETFEVVTTMKMRVTLTTTTDSLGELQLVYLTN